MGEAAADMEARTLIVCPLSTPELVDKVLTFIDELSGVIFYAYQSIFARRIIESVLNNEGATITALWARQCGKTEGVANTCVGMAVILPALANAFPDDERLIPYKKGFLVGVYAPIDKQAKLSFDRMRKIVSSARGMEFLADPEIGAEVLTNRADVIGFANGSIIIARTASPEAQIEGETHHLIVCEEAQKLSRSKVDKEISPMLASTNGTMVKIGTAWTARGGFHMSIQKNTESRKKGGKRNHFQFPYDMIIAEKRRTYEREIQRGEVPNSFHLQYEKYIKNEITRLGSTDSEEFKMNFMCLWQESRVIAINITTFTNAAIKEVEAGQSRGGFQVAGLDVGKMVDSTVLTVGLIDQASPIVNRYTLPGADEDKQLYYRKTILDWYEVGGPFEGDTGQYRRLVNYLRGTAVQVLVIDASSMGNPVFERIQALLEGTIIVVPYIFGTVTKHELYKYYLQELHSGRLKYCAGEETRKRPEYKRFVQQHEDLDRVEHGQYVVCEAPEGEHDDYPDSAALMCWAEKIAEQVKMPTIEVTNDLNPYGRPAGSSGRAGRYSRRY